MKNIAITLFSFVFAITLSAQQAPPQGINYQAMVYVPYGNQQVGVNSAGQIPANTKQVLVKFTLEEGNNGPLIYEETHIDTTDQYGLLNSVIGTGIPTSSSPGLFNQIDWSLGNPYLRVSITLIQYNSTVTSYQKLWSVPYALYADRANSSNTSDFSNNSAHADSSDYAIAAGNGISGVTDNGNGTLTFTYLDGSTYTTSVLTGLMGAPGPQGPMGQNGANGQSAYDIWIAQGNVGTEADFLSGLQGATGAQGQIGQNGLSAYEIWISQGNTGTEQDFLNSLQASATSSGPIFISPITVYTISSEYSITNSTVTVDFDTIIGHHVSSVILYYEHLCTSGSSTNPVQCKVDVNTNNIAYELCDHYNQMYQNTSYYVYGGSSGQVFLPLGANGIMTFTNNIIRTNFKIKIIGYFN
jgi:hypothetical protein